MPHFILSSLTCHRFVIASVTVSSKGLCDVFCTNSLYAKVGGISLTELNVLEREFLSAIDWQLMVSRVLISLPSVTQSWLSYVSLGPHVVSHQCTRETLQEYYVNLVRTHSTGRYTIIGPDTYSTSSDSSDVEMDSAQSRPSSPDASSRSRQRIGEASAILIDPGSVYYEQPRPTVEQNMAFAALRQSRGN
jgi:hypothetical protein